MKMFLMTALALISLSWGQSLPLSELSQIASYPGEDLDNGGGRTYMRIGNGGGNYHALFRIDLTGQAVSALCTLFVSQKTSIANGGADYDSGGFRTTVSTVKGTWVSGSANSDLEEGSVCWSQRAYSATTPVYWVDATSSSNLNTVSNGQAGSHINSTGIVWHTVVSGLQSYLVLDEAIIQDLKNGYGGLRISKSAGQAGEAHIFMSGVELRWDPNAPPVQVEAPVRGIVFSVVSAPNPAQHQVNFLIQGLSNPVVGIFDLQGRGVARLNGTAVWHGTDFSGQPVPSGVYVYQVEGARGVKAGTLRFVR